MDELTVFCRQIRSRSSDHRKAIYLLFQAEIYSQTISILRQELDSMVRVIYLLSVDDIEYRRKLIKDSVEGRQWRSKDGKKKITDKEMVDHANELQGWARSVYKFGCSFIHLSAFHDYNDRDPLGLIAEEEKEDIIRHIRSYHGGPFTRSPTIKDLYPYFPMIFDKVSGNLECYIKDLENEVTGEKLT